jgi:hypothetical protein
MSILLLLLLLLLLMSFTACAQCFMQVSVPRMLTVRHRDGYRVWTHIQPFRHSNSTSAKLEVNQTAANFVSASARDRPSIS